MATTSKAVRGCKATSSHLVLTDSFLQAQPPTPADACLPITGRWLQRVRPGDVLKLFDARGSSRSITVVENAGHGWWAESNQTTYVTSGTVLHLASQGQSLKILGRVGKLPAVEQAIVVRRNQRLILTKDQVPGRSAIQDNDGRVIRPARVPITLPQIFSDVRVGEEIWFDDGAIGGVIEGVGAKEIKVRITQAKSEGSKLRADKGINLPQSTLHLPALTQKDLEDLQFISKHADLVGYSFVRSATDVKELQTQLEALGGKQVGNHIED